MAPPSKVLVLIDVNGTVVRRFARAPEHAQSASHHRPDPDLVRLASKLRPQKHLRPPTRTPPFPCCWQCYRSEQPVAGARADLYVRMKHYYKRPGIDGFIKVGLAPAPSLRTGRAAGRPCNIIA